MWGVWFLENTTGRAHAGQVITCAIDLAKVPKLRGCVLICWELEEGQFNQLANLDAEKSNPNNVDNQGRT